MSTKKVVINECYGGFGVSPEALYWLHEKGYTSPGFSTPLEGYWKDENEKEANALLGSKRALNDWREFKEKNFGNRSTNPPSFLTVFSEDEKYILHLDYDIDRSNHLLIECIEALTPQMASGAHACLKIVEIPSDVKFVIDEYDGLESIHEEHRSWS